MSDELKEGMGIQQIIDDERRGRAGKAAKKIIGDINDVCWLDIDEELMEAIFEDVVETIINLME